jgi:fibro-slime domain-containing protein
VYGFEEFDLKKGSNRRCAENSPDNGGWSVVTTNRDGICFTGSGRDGYYHSCDKGGTNLKYGEGNGSKRGYLNGPDSDVEGRSWDQEVFVTRDMVRKTLDYSQCKTEDWIEGETEAIRGRYCARPMPAEGARCYGDRLQEWFTDGDKNTVKRIDKVLYLKKVSGTVNTYEVNYDHNSRTNWGCGHSTAGFFPLDTLNCERTANDMTFGRNGYYKWCNGNPCTGNNAGTDEELHNYGFSAAGSGEFKYDASKDDIFKFIGDDDMWIFIDGKLFENTNTGAHADLGGNHLAAPAVIKIQEYAQQEGWRDGTTHAINFFYVERQTDGSNLKLHMALTDLKPPRFGVPAIQKAETVKESDGSDYTRIYLNNKIDLEHIKRFIGSDQYPFIIHKSDGKEILAYKLDKIEYVKSEGSMQVYRIEGQVCEAPGVCGKTDTKNLFLNSGDWISFNVLRDDVSRDDGGDAGYWIDNNNFGLQDESWYIRAENNASNVAKTKVWGLNTTKLPPIDFTPDKPNTDPRKPDFNVDIWFTGNPDGGPKGGGLDGVPGGGEVPELNGSHAVNGGEMALQPGGTFPKIDQIWNPKTGQLEPLPNGKGNTQVHGFGVKGTPIPPNRAGELILTAYPEAGKKVNGMDYEDWMKNDTLQKLFGIPPQKYEVGGVTMPYGVANPMEQQPEGGFMFVKNGFPGESSVGGIQIAPTRCISEDRDTDKPKINCLSFSIPAKQPFQIAVTVYDQIGNFVTQYREQVSEQEFRSVVQAPTFMGLGGDINTSAGCRYTTDINDFGKQDVITINGYVKVNVNIYPFSADGRRFGNGVYLLKVDRVDMPYKGCVNMDGASNLSEEEFVRFHADTRFGWMRANSSNPNPKEEGSAGKKGLFKRR